MIDRVAYFPKLVAVERIDRDGEVVPDQSERMVLFPQLDVPSIPVQVVWRAPREVGAEMSLQVLAYNLKRVINLLGMEKTIAAMRLLAA